MLDPNNTTSQTYSPVFDAWFQIKKAYDDTPFVENMQVRSKNISGEKNPRAEPVNVYNNTTGDITSFTWVGGAAEYLGVALHKLRAILDPLHGSSPTYSSIHGAYFQVKKINDVTPFMSNMLTPSQKRALANKRRRITDNT